MNYLSYCQSFFVKTGNQEIRSQIIENDKARELYNDNLSSGNTAFLAEYSNEKKYSLSIGLLQSKEKIELITEFIQPILAEDLSYKFSFDLSRLLPKLVFKSKENSNSSLQIINFEAIIDSNSKITILISTLIELKRNFLMKIVNLLKL